MAHLIDPVDVEKFCRFCQIKFCCERCRKQHEEYEHHEELNDYRHQQRMVSECHICQNYDLPFGRDVIDMDLLYHIEAYHLPLKCNKCDKVFDKFEDFEKFASGCCKKVPDEDNLNLRTQRKNREFGKVDGDPKKGQAITRTTSTPLQMSMFSPFDMQVSSIRYSSTASIDDFSPPIIENPKKNMNPKLIVPISPNKKTATKTRSKIPSNNTPLRHAVMTKSIQRAIASNNEEYKKMGIQQRRMTFESTSSSYEQTISLLKLEVDAIEGSKPPENEKNDSNMPLDLRLSPAMRRYLDVEKKEKEVVVSKTPRVTTYEERKVVVHCSSDTTTITSFKSCFTDSITPKITGIGVGMKKTISFETPLTVEKTPVMLKLKPRTGAGNGSDDEDVFYTPQGVSPIGRRYSTESGIAVLEPLFMTDQNFDATAASGDLTEIIEESIDETSKPRKKIWNLVSSVMNYATTSTKAISADSGGSDSDTAATASEGSSKLSNIGMVLRRAAGYLTNFPGKVASQNVASSLKKRRHSSSASSDVVDVAFSPPIIKKRRIIGRKPINRMRE